jgi:hypothetical protein
MNEQKRLGLRLVGLGFLLAALPYLADWSDRLARGSLDRFLDPRLAFTVLFWLCGAAVGFALVRLAAFVLVSRGSGSPVLKDLALTGVAGTVKRIHGGRSLPGVRRPMQDAIWAIVVFAIIAILSALGTLDETRYLPPRAMVHDWADTSSRVRMFALTTPDNNPVGYLQDLTEIAHQLRASGARLVVAEDPGPITTVNTRLKSSYTQMRDSLRRAGDVILYERVPEWTRPVIRSSGFSRDTVHPGRSTIWTSIQPSTWDESRVVRWAPCLVTSAGPVYVDVGLVVAGRILGFPDTVAILCEPGTVRYGSIDVSITGEGWAPVMGTLNISRVFLNTSAGRGIGSDTLWYHFNDTKRYTFDRFRTFPDREVPEIAGSIVFVEWFCQDQIRLSGITYAGLVGSVVSARMAKLYGEVSWWVTAAVVMLGTFLCARWRLRFAVPLLLGLAVLLYGGGVWMLLTHRVVLALTYPAAAALLSAVIFPLVRLSHERPGP